jgi:hypothetical protein
MGAKLVKGALKDGFSSAQPLLSRLVALKRANQAPWFDNKGDSPATGESQYLANPLNSQADVAFRRGTITDPKLVHRLRAGGISGVAKFTRHI